MAIDPIRTRSAARANEHLASVRGTGAALVLGLMHYVVSAGTEDRGFKDESTQGWEALWERMLEYPPERAAFSPVTGRPSDAPTCVHPAHAP